MQPLGIDEMLMMGTAAQTRNQRLGTVSLARFIDAIHAEALLSPYDQASSAHPYATFRFGHADSDNRLPITTGTMPMAPRHYRTWT